MLLQAMGENTLQALLAISHRLSARDVPKHVASKAKSVFFDVGGYFMVHPCPHSKHCALPVVRSCGPVMWSSHVVQSWRKHEACKCE